jgi:hypothetical protein
MSDDSSQQQKGNGRGHHPNSIAAGTANLIPYKPGQSGNPGGNYKHTPKFNHTFERLLALAPEERKKYNPQNGVEELALAQINRAIAAEKDRDRITATEKIIDRVEGKAPQTINQNTSNLDVKIELSAAELLQLARRFNLDIDETQARELIELIAGEEEE